MEQTCKNCGNLEKGSIVKVTENGECLFCNRRIGGGITFGDFPEDITTEKDYTTGTQVRIKQEGDFVLSGVNYQRNNYIKSLQDFYAGNIEISKRKSSDYASDTDPYSNFREAETMGLTVEQGILLRMGDKWSRLKELIGKGKQAQVSDEKIEDTLSDFSNYCAILATYIKQRNLE